MCKAYDISYTSRSVLYVEFASNQQQFTAGWMFFVVDSNGQTKELVFPKALDLDRPKRARTQFSCAQLQQLERAFASNQYLVGRERSELAATLGLSETQVRRVASTWWAASAPSWRQPSVYQRPR